jgi:hypothetical protein
MRELNENEIEAVNGGAVDTSDAIDTSLFMTELNKIIGSFITIGVELGGSMLNGCLNGMFNSLKK